MTVEFERTTMLPVPPARAFDLSLDVDFHLQSFEESGETVVAGVRTGAMKLGDDVTWRARHFGVWWTMTSVITEFERPLMFVDEQRRGPFKRYRHEHRFTECDDGTTSMVDVVTFNAPLGLLGVAAERLILHRYLPKLIDQRNAELLAAVSVQP